MPANKHDDEIFREKRIIKNPIKFKISLNEEQKAAKELILKNTINNFVKIHNNNIEYLHIDCCQIQEIRSKSLKILLPIILL